ncbi:IS110 family transposase [Pontibacter qinzhouensis]|uniref:IS110 family transposase n=1 Tax=Pontibacter qinzhouensis TaxID=2603253 RepID=A0A5C8JK19_9BACT|nr:transposase [Pontibacter qinzhouensis]TXK37691.1 IS110 family transposase [Pontibacter qinzhouensis]
MEHYRFFIGIDVSKAVIDVFIHAKNLHRQFSNDRSGYDTFVRWAGKVLQAESLGQVLVCFEHTGLYSLCLSVYLEETGIPFAMVPALQLKRSMGITRGKSDKVDARRIAEFAYLYRETLHQTKLPAKAIMQLQPLLALRDRLVRDRAGYYVTQKEQRRFLLPSQLMGLLDAYATIISAMDTEIKRVEKVMQEIIEQDEELRSMLELITGIKGVGFLVGVYLIVFTHNFTRFATWRKFACYAGIAPFEWQSGTSIRGKTKVSPLANKQVKKMLHMAALSASRSDSELKTYYQKRLAEGKNKMCTLNMVRNKLVARVFAVATRKTAYVELMRHVA